MPHHHSANLDRKFIFGLILNTCLTVIELTAGIFSHSLALVSDAGHNFTDSLGIVIALLADRFGRRAADTRHSYGHERMTIIAALFNAAVLAVLAFYIFYEALQRIIKPAPVAGGWVIAVSLTGIIINGSIAYLFSKDKDLHMRSAFIGMVFDTLASVGALIAGIIIYYTRNTLADPLASIIIGIMLLFSTWEILRDSLHILLEGVPAGMDVRKIKTGIKTAACVKEVDDLHVWSLSSHDTALSCHVVVDECDLPKSIHIVREIKAYLLDTYKIGHATIEVELIPCDEKK